MTIRSRVAQLQGRANRLMSKADWTLDEAKEGIRLGVELMEMVMDGLAVRAVLDDAAVSKMLTRVVGGQGGELPAKLVVDLQFSHLPQAGPLDFVDGPYDGKQFHLTDAQREKKSIVLQGGAVYVWDGYLFRYDNDTQLDVLADN